MTRLVGFVSRHTPRKCFEIRHLEQCVVCSRLDAITNNMDHSPHVVRLPQTSSYGANNNGNVIKFFFYLDIEEGHYAHSCNSNTV